MEKSAVFATLASNAKFRKKEKKPKVKETLEVEKFNEGDLDDDSSSRRFFKIRVKGSNPPKLLLSFHDLTINPLFPLLENIENSKFKEPTPVQMQAIPSIIDARDVLAVAPTGSGKTASPNKKT